MKFIHLENKFVHTKLENLKSIKDSVCITTQEGHHIIRKRDITHLVADSNYTSIHFNDQKIICSQTIGSVFNKINHPNFIRSHQSYVFNLAYLKMIDKAISYVQLKSGIQLAIARSKKQIIKEIIQNRFD